MRIRNPRPGGDPTFAGCGAGAARRCLPGSGQRDRRGAGVAVHCPHRRPGGGLLQRPRLQVRRARALPGDRRCAGSLGLGQQAAEELVKGTKLADISVPVTCGRAVIDSLPTPLVEGAHIVCHAKPSFYANRGTLSLAVREIRLVGEGELLAVSGDFIICQPTGFKNMSVFNRPCRMTPEGSNVYNKKGHNI